MTQTERTGKTVFMYHVLNYCKCEDSNGGVYFCDVMVYLSCCCCVFNTETVACEYSYRLLQCCDPQFGPFDPYIFWQGIIVTLT